MRWDCPSGSGSIEQEDGQSAGDGQHGQGRPEGARQSSDTRDDQEAGHCTDLIESLVDRETTAKADCCRGVGQ